MIGTNTRYWLKWTIACGAGEFLGIGVAAAIATLHFRFLGEPHTAGQQSLFTLVMVSAGVIEGAVTGSFQWFVLKNRFVAVRARNWLGVTALGAVIAWLLGVLPSMLFAGQTSATPSTTADLSMWQMALFGALSGVVLGAVFGGFQWLEFRRHAAKAWRWILANSVAWIPGLGIIFVGASVPQAGTSLFIVITIATLSGLLGGLSVGAITGLFLITSKRMEG